jgi:ElaB/YqjD/DUF883 family membrane-anchored ribosome-binding protein
MPKTPPVAAATAELEALLGDLRTLLSKAELEAVPEVKALRERLDDGLHDLRDKAVESAQEAARRAREAARAADEYAHEEPWRVAGAALAVGALLGYLIGRR